MRFQGTGGCFRSRTTQTTWGRAVKAWHGLRTHTHGIVRKVRISDSADDPVTAAASRLESKLRRAIETAIASIQNQVVLKDLEAAILAGDENAVLTILDIENRVAAAFAGEGISPDQATVRTVIRDTYSAGAAAATTKLPANVGEGIAFDLLNPESVAFLREYELDLIRQISAGTREGIRAVLINSFENGTNPRTAAREIRGLIGLTENQANAVANFQRLLSGDPSELRQALTRTLRDRRFDPTLLRAIENETVLTADQIQTMTDRYFQRALKLRAETIARTESIRAANEGQRVLWNQGIEQGLIDPSRVQRRWVISGDERTCPICEGLAGTKAGIDEPFDGGYEQPPDPHPSCRCSVVLEFSRR